MTPAVHQYIPVIISEAYNFIESRTNNSICIMRPMNIFPTYTTIIVDLIDDDISFRKCYWPHDIKSVILIKHDEMPYSFSKKKLALFLYDRPTIHVITDSITDKLLDQSVLKIILQSHWSFMRLIIINKNIKCERGKFNEDILSIAERFLNDLWHRYQLVYVLIEFPLSCPHRFIIFDGKKKSNQNLYNRTITVVGEKDVHKTLKSSQNGLSHGFPLKTNIFYRFPTSIKLCNKIYNYVTYDKNVTDGYCGMDALIMHDFIKAFKFNVTFLDSEDINKYGYFQSGQATGSLGSVIRQEIDVSFNSRFIARYVDRGFDFLGHMSSDSLCALVEVPDIVPLWYYPTNIYDYKQWTIIIFMFLMIGIILWVYGKRLRQITGDEVYKPHVYVIEAVWIGMFGYFLYKKIQRSILIAICLLCSVVFTAKYQGHVNYMFATIVRYDEMNTLQDLCNSNIPVYTSPAIVMLLGARDSENSTNPITKILSRLKFYPTDSSYFLYHQRSATIERRVDVNLQMLLNYTDEDGRPLLYVVNECFRNFHLSYIVRSGFLFTSEMQNFMMKIVEAGLPEKYYKWTQFTIRLAEISRPTSEPRPFTKISLKEQRIPFFILVVGYLLSTILFVTEKWWDNRKSKIIKSKRSTK
ncbi:uncharacterized protein ACR2FA_002729 [Aphomia sociella]